MTHGCPSSQQPLRLCILAVQWALKRCSSWSSRAWPCWEHPSLPGRAATLRQRLVRTLYVKRPLAAWLRCCCSRAAPDKVSFSCQLSCCLCDIADVGCSVSSSMPKLMWYLLMQGPCMGCHCSWCTLRCYVQRTAGFKQQRLRWPHVRTSLSSLTQLQLIQLACASGACKLSFANMLHPARLRSGKGCTGLCRHR